MDANIQSPMWWLQYFGPLGLLLFFTTPLVWRMFVFFRPYFVRFAEANISLQQTIQSHYLSTAETVEKIEATTANMAKVQSDHGILLQRLVPKHE